MAHELANGRGRDLNRPTVDNTEGKVLLNRRDYVQLGAAAVAATLGAGGVVSASDSDGGVTGTYVTDFSEYSL